MSDTKKAAKPRKRKAPKAATTAPAPVPAAPTASGGTPGASATPAPKKAKKPKGAVIIINRGKAPRDLKRDVQVNGKLTTIPVGQETTVDDDVLAVLNDSGVDFTIVSEPVGGAADNSGSSAAPES